MSEDIPEADPLPPRLSRRQLLSVVVGNGLEVYNFVVYAIFAAQIGRSFFPSDRPGVSLLASLATFGVGFFTRPLGAIVIGRMADRIGRKPAMLLTFALVGLSVAGLALTPSYARIGPAAPVIAILFRLLQGFALGGETGPSTAFLLESAPPRRRGLFVSLQAMSSDAAVFVAGLVGVGLSASLGPAALDAWGWRVALLLGTVVVPFALIVRRTLVETVTLAAVGETRAERAPVRVIVIGLVMMSASGTVNYALTYLGTYAATTLGIVATSAFGATILVGLSGILADPTSGWLSDRFGRKPVMLVPAVLLLCSILPAFWLLVHHPDRRFLYVVSIVLALLADLSTVTILVTLTEQLPRRVRAGSYGMIYALSVSLFGGSTHFVVAWLIHVTGNPLAPAWYMTGGALVMVAGMAAIPESAPVRQRAPEANRP